MNSILYSVSTEFRKKDWNGYYEEHEMRRGEAPPIGLVIGADKSHSAVRYVIDATKQQLYASRYELQLPDPQRIGSELQRERDHVIEIASDIEFRKDAS